jgi:hypothetical protein
MARLLRPPARLPLNPSKPLGPPATLGVVAIDDLVSTGDIWPVGVAEMLRDNALKIGVDHSAIERPPVNGVIGGDYTIQHVSADQSRRPHHTVRSSRLDLRA